MDDWQKRQAAAKRSELELNAALKRNPARPLPVKKALPPKPPSLLEQLQTTYDGVKSDATGFLRGKMKNSQKEYQDARKRKIEAELRKAGA